MGIKFEKAINVLKKNSEWESDEYYNLADYNVDTIELYDLKEIIPNRADLFSEIKKALAEYPEEGPLVCFLDKRMLVQTADKGWNATPILFKAYTSLRTSVDDREGRLHMITFNRGRGALTTYWTDLWVKPDEDIKWLKEKNDFSVVLTGDCRRPFGVDSGDYSTTMDKLINYYKELK